MRGLGKLWLVAERRLGIAVGFALGVSLAGMAPAGCGGPPPPKLAWTESILAVEDLGATLAYYETVLGFCGGWDWEGRGIYGGIGRDGIGLMFQVDPEKARRSEGNVVYLGVNGDIDALWKEFKGRGAFMICDPYDTEWGMREFIVRDLNGIHLRFGKHLGGKASGRFRPSSRTRTRATWPPNSGPRNAGYFRRRVASCRAGLFVPFSRSITWRRKPWALVPPIFPRARTMRIRIMGRSSAS